MKYIFTISVINLYILGTMCFVTDSRMKQFLVSEINLQTKLQNHMYSKEDHLQKISSQFEPLFAAVYGRGSKGEYISNPLDTLTLVHRLTTKWLTLASLIGNFTDNKYWVDQRVLDIAVRNLARVQMTYNLSTDHLADSVLEDVPARSNLTGADCYRMARHYYQKYHYQEAVQWLDQALTKHDDTVPRHWLLELSALSYCFLGQSNTTASTIGSLMSEFPRHKPSRSLVSHWHFMLNHGCKKAHQLMRRKIFLTLPMDYSRTIKYNQICQGNVKISSDLKCRYVHYHKRHLRLAPFRLEELHLDPPVVIYHNAILESEIQEIKRLVSRKLKKSVVLAENGSLHEDPYRTSESSFIFNGQSALLDRMTHRTGEMTNLDMKFAEPHQITRYGLGGEFLFHGDYFGEIAKKSESGDRIATLLFYILSKCVNVRS